MAGAKHAGGFRKGFDDSLDDLVPITVSLKSDVELVAAHEADPQHHFSHAHPSQILSLRPNPVAQSPLCHNHKADAHYARAATIGGALPPCRLPRGGPLRSHHHPDLLGLQVRDMHPRVDAR